MRNSVELAHRPEISGAWDSKYNEQLNAQSRVLNLKGGC
jgi:hypothetical protein